MLPDRNHCSMSTVRVAFHSQFHMLLFSATYQVAISTMRNHTRNVRIACGTHWQFHASCVRRIVYMHKRCVYAQDDRWDFCIHQVYPDSTKLCCGSGLSLSLLNGMFVVLVFLLQLLQLLLPYAVHWCWSLSLHCLSKTVLSGLVSPV